MQLDVVPVFLFVACATAMSIGLLMVSGMIGPSKQTQVKEMPYESGMDPIHDARRRFDVRFNLVAIVFLVFDVELLVLYPWAVATRNKEGIGALISSGQMVSRNLVFVEAILFILLLGVGYLYAWRKGVFRWR